MRINQRNLSRGAIAASLPVFQNIELRSFFVNAYRSTTFDKLKDRRQGNIQMHAGRVFSRFTYLVEETTINIYMLQKIV